MTSDQDRRARRTREAVIHAFASLALSRRYDRIRTADVIAAADIGRSTFYEHFAGKDEVLLAAIEPVLTPLANAASGRAGVPVLRMMLDHLWEQRALGRVILDSAAAPKLRRRLADMIETRLVTAGGIAHPFLFATGAAAGQLAMLRLWVAGEISCPAVDLARQLCAFIPMDDATVKDAKTIRS